MQQVQATLPLRCKRLKVLDLEVEGRKEARSEKCPRPVYYRNTVCGRVQPARLLAGWMHPAIEIFTLYFKGTNM